MGARPIQGGRGRGAGRLMCKCTPNIRTPFCGRPGCEWPEGSRTQREPPPSPAAREFARCASEEIERLAREDAAESGFDIDKEPHGLFRAMMAVLSSPDKMKLAITRMKARQGDTSDGASEVQGDED